MNIYHGRDATKMIVVGTGDNNQIRSVIGLLDKYGVLRWKIIGATSKNFTKDGDPYVRAIVAPGLARETKDGNFNEVKRYICERHAICGRKNFYENPDELQDILVEISEDALLNMIHEDQREQIAYDLKSWRKNRRRA